MKNFSALHFIYLVIALLAADLTAIYFGSCSNSLPDEIANCMGGHFLYQDSLLQFRHGIEYWLSHQYILWIPMILFCLRLIYTLIFGSKKVLECFAAYLDRMRWENHLTWKKVDGFYKGRYIECYSGFYAVTGLGYQAVSDTHLLLKTSLVDELGGKYFASISKAVSANLYINFASLKLVYTNDTGTEFKDLLTGRTSMTPEKARDVLNEMVSACEKIKSGDIAI